jgi:hypothetical protein
MAEAPLGHAVMIQNKAKAQMVTNARRVDESRQPIWYPQPKLLFSYVTLS